VPWSRILHNPFDVLQQLGRIERLHHEIHGTVAKRLLPDVVVIVSGDEDDRRPRALLPDATLQFESMKTGQPDVRNYARRSREDPRFQKFLGGAEQQGLVTSRFEDALNRLSNPAIIIDRCDEVFRLYHNALLRQQA
jgi:hypothetical protein